MNNELFGRKVQAKSMVESATPPHERRFVDEPHKGSLIGFGIMWEELNVGVGQYTTAIVEYSNGTIAEYPVDNIRFVE